MSHVDPELITALQAEWTHLLLQGQSRIHHCVRQLSEAQLWWRPGPDQNSIGIVIRHVAGNLNQWVVHGVPHTAHERDRSAEFSEPDDRSATSLLAEFDSVVAAANTVIAQLLSTDLLQPRTIQGFETTVMGALMHSVPHLVGHTHQIVQLTRQQLQAAYRFHWNPDAPRNEIPL